jgi:hypothetical protein
MKTVGTYQHISTKYFPSKANFTTRSAPLNSSSTENSIKLKTDSVKFGGGGGDPFSAAYEVGTIVKDIVQKNPVDPLKAMAGCGGNAFNLYHLYKIDALLHDIKASVAILQNSHLNRGIEMLDSSLEAAGEGKLDIAHRDLGFAKDAFATSAHTSNTNARKALSYDYLAKTYALDGMESKAKSSQETAYNILKEDFRAKAAKMDASWFHPIGLFALGKRFTVCMATGGLATDHQFRANYDAIIAQERMIEYAKRNNYYIPLNLAEDKNSNRDKPISAYKNTVLASYFNDAVRYRGYNNLSH